MQDEDELQQDDHEGETRHSFSAPQSCGKQARFRNQDEEHQHEDDHEDETSVKMILKYYSMLCLFSFKKCCNHPYLVDAKLQGKIIMDLNLTRILDVDMSGKLQFLDLALLEVKKRQLRCLSFISPQMVLLLLDPYWLSLCIKDSAKM
nr:helicase protein MOM1-like isoform X1 [Tanacetum cinerariifolium]